MGRPSLTKPGQQQLWSGRGGAIQFNEAFGCISISILVSRVGPASRPGTMNWVAPEYWGDDPNQVYGAKIDVVAASLV